MKYVSIIEVRLGLQSPLPHDIVNEIQKTEIKVNGNIIL